MPRSLRLKMLYARGSTRVVLLAEAFESWADEALEELKHATDQPPAIQITLVVESLRRDDQSWHKALGAATRHNALRERAQEVTADYIAWVQRVIEYGVKDGSLSCADPSAPAWRVVLLLDGLVAMVLALRSLDLDDAVGLLGGAVERDLTLQNGSFESAGRILLSAG